MFDEIYLLLVFTLISILVYAQVTSSPGKKIKQSNSAKNEVSPPEVGPGCQLLNQDQMPCLVPDMTQLASMPNSIRADQKIQFIPDGYQIAALAGSKKINTSRKLPK